MKAIFCAFAALFVLVVLFESEAHACMVLRHGPFEYEEGSSTATCPEASVRSVEVFRGVGPEYSCSGMSATSCDDHGTISITLDRVEDCGYLLTLVEGSLPDGMSLPDYPIAPRVMEQDGKALSLIRIHWNDGATHGQEAFLPSWACRPWPGAASRASLRRWTSTTLAAC